jgi:hypothetical protein
MCDSVVAIGSMSASDQSAHFDDWLRIIITAPTMSAKPATVRSSDGMMSSRCAMMKKIG